MSDPSPQLTILVQLHDELPVIPELYLQLTTAGDALGRTYEILFVDDGSHDGSSSLLDTLVDEDPRVRVIHLRRHFGKNAALAVGFARARGEVVVTLDADLQDDPAMIADFLARIEGGADLVTGWPQRPSYPPIARLEGALIHRFVGLEVHDLDCGLRAYRREALRQLADQHGAARLLPVLAYTRGLRVQELVVNHREPRHQRIRARDHRRARLAEVLEVVAQAGRARPLRVLAVPGAITIAAGLIVLLLFGVLVPLHFMTGMWLGLGLLLAIFGGQLVVAGILGEMVLGVDRPVPAHALHAITAEREADADELETRARPATPRTSTGTVVTPATPQSRPVTYSNPIPPSARATARPVTTPALDEHAVRQVTGPAPIVPAPIDHSADEPTPLPFASPQTEQFVAGSLRLPTRTGTASNPAVPNPLDVEIDEDEGPTTIAVDRNPFYRPPR